MKTAAELETYLRDVLQSNGGTIPVAELNQRIKSDGYSRSKARAVLLMMGAVKRKIGTGRTGPWQWTLNATASALGGGTNGGSDQS